jgi:tetratricopeptide (TPR) repeat protein
MPKIEYTIDIGTFCDSLKPEDIEIFDAIGQHVREHFPGVFDTPDVDPVVLCSMYQAYGLLSYHNAKRIIEQQAAQLDKRRPLRILNLACGSDFAFPVVDYICYKMGLPYEYVGVDINKERMQLLRQLFKERSATYVVADASSCAVVEKALGYAKVKLDLGFDIVRIDHPEVLGTDRITFISILTWVMPRLANPKAHFFASSYTSEEMEAILLNLSMRDAKATQDPQANFCIATQEIANRYRETGIPAHDNLVAMQEFVQGEFSLWVNQQDFAAAIPKYARLYEEPLNKDSPISSLPPYAFQFTSQVQGQFFARSLDDISYQQVNSKLIGKYYKSGSYLKSLLCCQWLIESGGKDAATYFSAGRCCIQLGLLDNALEYLEKALELAGDDKRYYYEISMRECQGFIEHKKGNYSDAKKILRDVVLRLSEFKPADRSKLAADVVGDCGRKIEYERQRVFQPPASSAGNDVPASSADKDVSAQPRRPRGAM